MNDRAKLSEACRIAPWEINEIRTKFVDHAQWLPAMVFDEICHAVEDVAVSKARDFLDTYAQRAVEAATQELRDDRDSWMEQASARTADAVKWADERDALRLELEGLRAQKPFAWAHEMRSDDGRHEKTLTFGEPDPWQDEPCEVVVMSIPLYTRPIPPDARQGREPLTDEAGYAAYLDAAQAQDASAAPEVVAADMFIRGIAFAEKHHGIGPAGTSADGEPQP